MHPFQTAAPLTTKKQKAKPQIPAPISINAQNGQIASSSSPIKSKTPPGINISLSNTPPCHSSKKHQYPRTPNSPRPKTKVITPTVASESNADNHRQSMINRLNKQYKHYEPNKHSKQSTQKPSLNVTHSLPALKPILVQSASSEILICSLCGHLDFFSRGLPKHTTQPCKNCTAGIMSFTANVKQVFTDNQINPPIKCKDHAWYMRNINNRKSQPQTQLNMDKRKYRPRPRTPTATSSNNKYKHQKHFKDYNQKYYNGSSQKIQKRLHQKHNTQYVPNWEHAKSNPNQQQNWNHPIMVSNESNNSEPMQFYSHRDRGRAKTQIV